MDALTLMMVLFLNMNEPCTARPAEERRVAGDTVQILPYDCGEKRFRVWFRRCREGGYWSRPFLLEEENSQSGFYLNRFAEIHHGWHVRLDDTYVPACGT